jgi:hypothetical protein
LFENLFWFSCFQVQQAGGSNLSPLTKVHMRDLNVRPAPPAGSGIHAKPNQVMISKSTGATKIRPYSHNQVPKIITVVQKRIMEIHFMIPFLTQNFPQKVTISKSIMIDWFIKGSWEAILPCYGQIEF